MATRIAAQEKMDISAALTEAAANQPTILRAEAALDAAFAREAEAKAAYFPTIDGNVSLTHAAPQRGQKLDFEPNLPINVEVPASTENPVDIGLGFGMVVYDAGARARNLDLARLEIESTGIDINRAKVSVEYSTARAFYALLFLRAELEVLNEQASVLVRHLDEAKAREETGSSTHYDVLTTQVRAAAVSKQQIEIQNLYEKEKVSLAQLTNRPENFEVVGDFHPLRHAINEESSIRSATDSCDDLKLTIINQHQAQIESELAAHGQWPTVTLKASAGYKNGVLTYDNSDVDKLVFCWNVGVLLDVPIFDGFRAAHKRDEFMAILSATENREEELRRDTASRIRMAIDDVTASRLQTENSLAQLAAAGESLAIARAQYSLGVFTNVQFLDSQTSLELAKLDNLRAIYNEVLCELTLKQAMGEDLSELIYKQ